jgi:hypothetical protein
MYVHSGIVPGEDAGLGAALNGIQIRRIVPCAEDVSPNGGNGIVNIDDLTQVILNWGSAGPAGDVTANGAVDIDDLTAVILGWGTCE